MDFGWNRRILPPINISREYMRKFSKKYISKSTGSIFLLLFCLVEIFDRKTYHFLIWIHLPVEDYSKTCHQLMLLLAQTRYKVSVAVRTYGESSDAEARSTFTVWFIHLCVIRATWLCLACFSEHFFISFFMILKSKSISTIHPFPHSFVLSSRSHIFFQHGYKSLLTFLIVSFLCAGNYAYKNKMIDAGASL